MKKLNFLLVLFAPTLFMFNSCAPAATTEQVAEINMDTVKAQIMALEAAYAVAENANDVDGVASYYANDAESLADNEPTRVGMDAIKAGIKKDMAADTSGNMISFATTGVWAGGKYATETGTTTVTNKEGKVVSTGKYIALFELRDGKYVAIRDMWNSDAPRPAAAQ